VADRGVIGRKRRMERKRKGYARRMMKRSGCWQWVRKLRMRMRMRRWFDFGRVYDYVYRTRYAPSQIGHYMYT
jgi:hypothetical protein